MAGPKSLIVNSPYERPAFHWRDERGALVLAHGRRPAGYEVFDTRHKTRRTRTIALVERIRERVDVWRAAGWPGVTTVTRALLEHWHEQGVRPRPFYFCQLEAIETLIWWVEAPAREKQGIVVPGDGGGWPRLCAKMATGTGKTALMAMIVTWQVLNAITDPGRAPGFSRAVLVVAPGITVKERLQVLYPGHPGNSYDEFVLCPSVALRQRLNQAELLIENWHALMPLHEPARGVVQRGAESDRAFARRVLGKLANYQDIVVLNDEAHHAYRAEARGDKEDAEAPGPGPEEATRWIEGLDRIDRALGIARCFDLSATPFTPTGNTRGEQDLFEWIVSDFGLNDAIEAGLVKTPRTVVRDGVVPDTNALRTALYHLYRDPAVSGDLTRRGAAAHEPLPALVQQAYALLGADWQETARRWRESGHRVPPVLLTVCNRTETAARIEHHFLRTATQCAEDEGDAPDLRTPARTLRVDSRVLDRAEKGETAAPDRDYEARLRQIVAAADIPEDMKTALRERKKEELLREIVDNVGKRGRAGQDLQHVISVAMLSEGWDAKNVTHILGLRAFTSQLLCEQVIGRGLRRVSHDTETVVGPDGVTRQLFVPEFANVFGVPLSIVLDGEDREPGAGAPPPPRPGTQVESLRSRNHLELRWPNVVRIETVVRPTLVVDWSRVEPLALGADALAPISPSDRVQRLVFLAAREAIKALGSHATGEQDLLAFQLIRLVDQFLASPHRSRAAVLDAPGSDRIVQHLLRFVTVQHIERREPIFDHDLPVGSTRNMRTWYTSRCCRSTTRSQISHMIADSELAQHAAQILENSPFVVAFARNEHLGFQVPHLWNGARRRYLPDFLIRLTCGKTLVLESEGSDRELARAGHRAMRAWVEGVNHKGGFGEWCFDVADEPTNIEDILRRHGAG